LSIMCTLTHFLGKFGEKRSEQNDVSHTKKTAAVATATTM